MACSAIDEPQVNNTDRNSCRTRADLTIWRPYSASEAIKMADNKLGKNLVKTSERKIDYLLLQDQSLEASLISDTIAYIINYGNENGFVVIANDSRVSEPLAYSDKGNLQNSTSAAKSIFLDNIEIYLASLRPIGADTSSPAINLFITPQVTVKLSPEEPFNTKIDTEHPRHGVNWGCLAAAGIISCLKDKFIYHGYEYNFSSINYALNQGPGFDPVVIFPNTVNTNFSINKTFPYSYNGSASAYNQLLYDLGEDTNIQYLQNEAFSYTAISTVDVNNTLKNLNFEVSFIHLNHNINVIVDSLIDGSLIYMGGFAFNKFNEKIESPLIYHQIQWIVDGCDV